MPITVMGDATHQGLWTTAVLVREFVVFSDDVVFQPDLFKKAPWHIFIFAFGMYVQIYGLHPWGCPRCSTTIQS